MRLTVLFAGVLALTALFAGPAMADVRCVQSSLARLGFDPGPVDGLMGNRTRQAAGAFAANEDELPVLTEETSAQWCEILREHTSHLPRFDVVSRPAGVLSQRDTERLWNAYKRARVCFDHPTYGSGERLRIRRFSAAELAERKWTNPFMPKQPEMRPNAASLPARIGEPIKTVVLDESYGQRVPEVDRARAAFTLAIAKFRSGIPDAEAELKQALLEWAEADAFQKGIHVSWGHKSVDWQMMTAIMTFVTAAGTIAETLTGDEKAVIGPWLNRLVAESANSRWKDRQDNKAFMKTYMTMLWGLMIGDDEAVQAAIDTFKLAIHDMRPDGSMPIDTQRSGMGLKYNSDSASYLVMMAALLRANTDLDLFAYEVDGRSLHDAVDFVVRSVQSPVETNKIYAISCPDGGDRWGSVDAPSTSFVSSATYLLPYAALFPDAPHSAWIEKRYRSVRSTANETFGGAPALLFDFGR